MTLPAHNSTENIWMNLYVWDGKQRSKKKKKKDMTEALETEMKTVK